jgi:repressor LexA
MLPKGQQRVWNTLLREYHKSGAMPYPYDLTAALKMAPQSLHQHLQALERKGLLEIHSRGRGGPTSLRFTLEGKRLAGVGIPLLGSITAGSLSDATQEYRGLIALPGKPGEYGIVVEGDSMAEYLLENDWVVVKEGLEPKPKEIVAVYHQGKTTLKYLSQKGKQVILEPHNKTYPTLELPASEVKVQGVFQYMLRGKGKEQLLEVTM